jgi:ubiquinone/menaquinone biosynthesis C-methylase UbiE
VKLQAKTAPVCAHVARKESTMSHNEFVKNQFNLQAAEFGNWSVTKNLEYLKAISEFISFKADDTLLDVATGTGDFPLFVAPQIKHAVGIDISDKMVDLANSKKSARAIANVEFRVSDVEQVPFPDNCFSVVSSKSAFHHMPDYKRVFKEMVRCCMTAGKVAVCDIVAFEDREVDGFFERFERCVDASHCKTLSRNEFAGLFKSHGISLEKSIEVEIEHTVAEYLSHAKQTEKDLLELDDLLSRARDITCLGDYWTFGKGNQDTRFRKKVILLLGRK